MGKTLLVLAGLTVLASESLVSCISLTSRRYQFCEYMSDKIYCYGGVTSVLDSTTVDDKLYLLDIAKFSGQTTELINEKWEIVDPSTPFDTESRRISSAIVLPDKKRLLLQGGYTKGTKFINQTIIYDTVSNSWKTILPYTEANRGIRQIYSATAVNLPNNLVGFYGGFEQFANTSVPQVTASGATMPYWDNSITAVGFNDMKMYSPEATSWSSFSPQNNIPANYYPDQQTATLDPVSGKVYYLGGMYYTPIHDEILVPFNWAFTFNTESGAWANETLYGGVYPSKRIGHTAHLLPNSRDIILYGGTGGDDKTGQAAIDYCFTLNLTDNTWTERSNLNVPPNLSGPRFLHSSVLVDTTLFILFGKGVDGTLQQSMLAINVADVANLSYSATFGASNSLPGTPPASGLSKGAIGGIVAGIVIVVLVILAAIVFCVRRRRNLEKSKAQNNQDGANIEQIHVDWDKIDDQYRETPTVGLNATNSSLPTNSPYSTNSMSATARRSFSPEADSNYSAADAGILKPDISAVKPDIGGMKPSIDITDRGYTLNKPNEF